jgi:hypothetical protein
VTITTVASMKASEDPMIVAASVSVRRRSALRVSTA